MTTNYSASGRAPALLRYVLAAMLFALGAICSQAQVVVDQESQLVYNIIDDTETVSISQHQTLQSFYGTFTIPKTVTDTNIESQTYGKTFTVVSMERGAFKSCNMEGVVIEAELPIIPAEAFQYCWNLKSITLPESITQIHSNAFQSCSALQEINLEKNLVEIMDKAFYKCSSLTTIDFSKCTELGAIRIQAFSECRNLQTLDFSACTKLTYIGTQAFESCDKLNFPIFAEIPDICLWHYAFRYCYNLGTVNLPVDCHLYHNVFQSSTISELNFPLTGGNVLYYKDEANDTYVSAESAFKSATLPEEFTIPATIDYIPTETFRYLKGVKKITFADNPELSISSNAFSYDKDTGDYSKSLTRLEFKGRVKYIGQYAFQYALLDTLALPPCEQIDDWAFYKNLKLKSVTFPEEKITYVGDGLFSNCSYIETAEVPEWLTRIPASLYENCMNLNGIKIPSQCEYIGDYAFYNNRKLTFDTETPFPETLKMIGTYAFYASAITDLRLPVSISRLDPYAFKQSESLNLLNFHELENLTEVSTGVFMNCFKIEEVKCPKNLKQLGDVVPIFYTPGGGETKMELNDGVFQGCSNLKRVEFNPGLIVGNDSFSKSGVEEIVWADDLTLAPCVFRFCFNLTSVEIPGYIKQVPDECFYECKRLDTVKFNEGTVNTGARAFMNSPVWHVTWAKTIETVEEGSFACTGYNGLYRIPDHIKYIGKFAFWRCCNTGTLIIPPTVRRIDDGAFIDNQFSTIEFPEFTEDQLIEGEAPLKLGTNVFANNMCKTITLPSWMKKVPEGLFCQDTNDQAYKYRVLNYSYPHPGNAYIPKTVYTNHYKLLESVTFADGTTEIGARAFANNTMLKIGNFQSTITYYGEECFLNGGMDLTTEEEEIDGEMQDVEQYLGVLICPEGVTFGQSAFNSAKIRSITMAGCATFGDKALAGMKYIEEFEFPECMTVIPSGFCSSWSNLRKASFRGNKVVRIEREAFKNCPHLENSVLDFHEMTDLTFIGESAFEGCASLNGELDFSGLKNLRTIEKKAFNNGYITSIKWPDSQVTLGEYAFFMCPIEGLLTIPGNMKLARGCFAGGNKDKALKKVEFKTSADNSYIEVPNLCFAGRDGLKEVKFNGCKDLRLGHEPFLNCDSLVTFQWPADVDCKYTLQKRTFYQCKSLVMDRIPESIVVMPDSMFTECKSLVRMELPGVTEIGGKAFRDCTALQFVHLQANISNIYTEAFYNCYNLEQLRAARAPFYIASKCFYNCQKLTDFIVDDIEAMKINEVANYAFENCYVLNDLPDIFSPTGKIGPNAFQGCRKFRHLRIPCNFDDYPYTTTKYNGYASECYPTNLTRFKGCYDLQAIDFIANGKVMMYKNDFQQQTSSNVNSVYHLKPSFYGISRVSGNVTSVTTLAHHYSNWENTNMRFYTPIKMLVPRATKQLFVKAGYEKPITAAGLEKYFDIREVKDPKFNLNGEIWSDFEVGKDINHYTGVIRWELEYSDLNEKEPTIYELWRDGNKVAKFEFLPAELLPDGVTDGAVNTTEPTYKVAYKVYDKDDVEITDKLTYGAFYFERSLDYYDWVVQSAQTYVYFNASKTSRDGQDTKLGNTSWFLYKDHFDSQKLDGVGVPVSHTYTIRMKNYKYEEWENNDNYAKDATTGLYWHMAEKRTGDPDKEWLESDPCVIYTSIAHPSIGIDGMYTLDEVKADKERKLGVTKVDSSADYALTYNVHGGAVYHRLYGYYNNYVVKKVQAFKLAERSLPSDTIHQRWGEAKELYGNPAGSITGPEYNIVPGKTAFQTVTYAGHRGTFGSPKVSLYGEPGVEALQSFNGAYNHSHVTGTDRMYESRLNIKALLDKFGYTKDYTINKDNHFVGIWRVSSNAPLALMSSPELYADDETEESPNETLIWHSDGLHPDEYMEDCEYCKHYGYDAEKMVYHDAIPVPHKSISEVYYIARLYVQKPDDPSQYAVAEAVSNPLHMSEIFTSVDELTQGVGAEEFEDILANGELFDMTGLRIERPAKGSVFVAIHHGKAYKLKMTK